MKEMIRMNTPDEVIAAAFGNDCRITGKRPVYGGDINRAYQVMLSDGQSVFMKANSPDNLSFFETEANGLEALRQTKTISVPRVIGI